MGICELQTMEEKHKTKSFFGMLYSLACIFGGLYLECIRTLIFERNAMEYLFYRVSGNFSGTIWWNSVSLQ